MSFTAWFSALPSPLRLDDMPDQLAPHIKLAFENQSAACVKLGSNFTALLCALIARDGVPDGNLQTALNNWAGDVSPSGDSLPLRLMGALHNLVITDKAPALKLAYPPNMHPGESALANLLQDTIETHENHILDFLQFAPQTNETARSATLLPGFLLLAQKFKLPIIHSELGASAGLNLNWDCFSYDYGKWQWGAKDSKPLFTPKWTGPQFENISVNVINKRGCDINPIDLETDSAQMRLKSYVWPDQNERKTRLDDALKVANAHPNPVDQSEALPWLKERLANTPQNTLHVVTHTIVWQYFPQETKLEGEAAFKQAGAHTSPTRPLARLRLEADDFSPGAALTLSYWDGNDPNGYHIALGRADFHGRWINWNFGTRLENFNE